MTTIFITVTLLAASATLVQGRPQPTNNQKAKQQQQPKIDPNCQANCRATFDQCLTIAVQWVGKFVCLNGQKVCNEECNLLRKIDQYFMNKKMKKANIKHDMLHQ